MDRIKEMACMAQSDWILHGDRVGTIVERALRSLLPPAGHVLLPDGRCVKVLGTLPMTADGRVVGDGGVFWLLGEDYDDGSAAIAYAWNRFTVMDGPDKGSWALKDSVESCYSTREAATAAAGEGA